MSPDIKYKIKIFVVDEDSLHLGTCTRKVENKKK